MESSPKYSKKLINKQELFFRKESKEQDQILCRHCKRTKYNETSCLGICVADNDY